MSNCAIVGINWGDEGKGRMVDLIARDYDIVCRYQGGNNAGHTIVNEYGKFALHLIPSGICLPGVVNVLGNGVVIDLESLCGEIEALQNAGVPITPENFKISERATIVFPYHRALDGLEEARLKDKKYGSTLRGIAPVYSDKYQKKTVMMGELRHMDKLEKRLAGILEWKNLTIEKVYGAEGYKLADMMQWLRTWGEKLLPYICDTGAFLRQAQRDGKRVAVPKVYGDEMRFLWLDDLQQVAPGAYGIPEPIADGPVAMDETALVLMPGLAFDREGFRLGYGGGFYDKYLAAHPKHVTLALCYGFQMFDHLDVDDYDIPVQYVISAPIEEGEA